METDEEIQHSPVFQLLLILPQERFKRRGNMHLSTISLNFRRSLSRRVLCGEIHLCLPKDKKGVRRWNKLETNSSCRESARKLSWCKGKSCFWHMVREIPSWKGDSWVGLWLTHTVVLVYKYQISKIQSYFRNFSDQIEKVSKYQSFSKL